MSRRPQIAGWIEVGIRRWELHDVAGEAHAEIRIDRDGRVWWALAKSAFWVLAPSTRTAAKLATDGVAAARAA